MARKLKRAKDARKPRKTGQHELSSLATVCQPNIYIRASFVKYLTELLELFAHATFLGAPLITFGRANFLVSYPFELRK
jgi:hypothetical protein